MNHDATRLDGQLHQVQCHQVQRLAEDDFLSPLTINERNDLVGPGVCQTSARCSDKGFLPMSLGGLLRSAQLAHAQTDGS